MTSIVVCKKSPCISAHVYELLPRCYKTNRNDVCVCECVFGSSSSSIELVPSQAILKCPPDRRTRNATKENR
jgi:hypothetical protein